MRYVVKLRGARPVEARVVIQTEPGKESHVDYGEGPMVRDATTGTYRSLSSRQDASALREGLPC